MRTIDKLNQANSADLMHGSEAYEGSDVLSQAIETEDAAAFDVCAMGADALRSVDVAEPLPGGMPEAGAQYRAEINKEVPFIHNLTYVSEEEIDAAHEANKARLGPQAAWQERVFGPVSIDQLRQDAKEHLERPVQDRKGQAIIIDGREKRPIVDLQLDDDALVEVVQKTTRRKEAVEHVTQELTQRLQAGGKKLSTNEVDELLFTAGVRERDHGQLMRDGRNHNPGATVADLYVDESDLAVYDTLDELCNRLTDFSGREDSDRYDSREMFASAVMQLAAHSFPSGVELNHAIKAETLTDIVDHGALAPRSQRKHGHVVHNDSFNGAFIHLTGPGGVATEYGDGRLVAGVPIDTIVRHSPYMQLESAYIGNSFSRAGKSHSMQYKMGAVRINDLDDAPEVFRNAFRAQRDAIAAGLKPINIGQGVYDNLSFAAGDTADTAGRYSYPLEEISLYATASMKERIREAVDKTPKAQAVLAENMHIAFSDRNRSASFDNMPGKFALPNFDPDTQEGMAVYMPMSSHEVPFTEERAGNDKKHSMLPHTLDTIMAPQLPRFLEGLIKDGMNPSDALHACIAAVNDEGASLSDLIYSYNGGADQFQAEGLTFADLLESVSNDVIERYAFDGMIDLRNIQEIEQHDLTQDPDYSEAWSKKGKHASSEEKKAMIWAYADRLWAAGPSVFCGGADAFEQYGYQFTDEQRSEVMRFREEEKLRYARAARNLAPPRLPSSGVI